jgi:hypothetical protein
MEESIALRFLESFSIITIGENKVPNFPWLKCKSEKLTEDEFIKNYRYKGGIVKKDGTDLPATNGLGIVTGFEFLEVIDIDLKVFSTTKEMTDFWDEYLSTLKELIYDFDNKFVIYKTKSGGYHILYKSKRVVGNKKIAVLKGHTQAVIESRGLGGYVFIYPKNKVSLKSYFEVDFITDEDRELVWNISKAYNYEEPKPEKVEKKTKEYFSEGITPWADFNNQNDVLDVVVPDDFTIPNGGFKSKYTLIKRHGTTAAHSGYVFKDSGCMYLFSTGTIYPHEKLISAYEAYTIKYHNGDFSASAKDLYEQGFGERVKIKEIEPIVTEKIIVENTEFPIDIFPKQFQFYIKDCADKLQMNIDYMGCSLLWLISVCVGNSFEIEVKAGWKEKAALWVALVGQAGIGKTPSIDRIIFPLQKINNKEIKKYIEDYKKYEDFNSLSKKERKEIYGENYEVHKPTKTQFIVNDITLEALVDMHQENDNSLGVFKDELAGWLKDMNKYRAGSDLEFWLSTWSGKSVNVNRMTRAGSFVDKPFIPVLGGIQPTIFNNLTTEETKENGFMDRLLLAYPDAKAEYYVESELDYEAIRWYGEAITSFFNTMNKGIKRVEKEIVPTTIQMNDECKKEWVRIFNKITDNQNNDEENQYLKSMYPKQKSYIPRFALLIHIFESFFNDKKNVMILNSDTMLKAEKLSDYFVNNAKKVKIDSTETNDLRNIINKEKNSFDKIKSIYLADKDFNRTKAAELIGISRRQVISIINKIEENKK